MDKIGIRTIVVNFDDEQLPYLSLVQGDAKTRGFDIVICDSDGKEIPPSDDYIVELVATGSNAPDTPYANRHTIKDGKYRVMIPTEALSKSGFVFLQLVFYQKSTGAVIHTIEQKCPVYRSRGQEVVESNNLYVDITALRLGLERIEELDSRYESMLGEEKIRQDAEDKRNLDEAIRKDNESIRKANEIKRENNEDIRIDNENNRIIAEEERGIKFDSWDKTMEGIIPNATDTEKGVVKIDKTEGEEAPHTVPTIGTFDSAIAVLKSDVAKKQDKLTAGDNIDITGNIISAVDTIYNDTQIKADVAKKQDKLTAGDNIAITRDTISATDTITTVNGKTGAISKADIIALGIPSQDTVYKKPSSEPISYIQGLQAELDSKVESYGTNPVLNVAVISAGGSTTGIPNNTLILELE